MHMRGPSIKLAGRLTALAAVALLVFSLLLADGCGGSPEGGQSLSNQTGVPVTWKVGGILNSSTVEIVSDVGYCVGDPRPRFGKIVIARRGNRVYIKPYVVNPPPETGPCRGVGYFEKRAIDLGEDVEGLRLYDATTEPPTLRWPRD